MTEPSHASPSSPPPLASATSPPAPPPPAPPPAPVTFPITWLLENAAPPIRYRALRDVARPPQDVIDAAQVLAYAYPPALHLVLQQAADGTWNRSMLAIPGPRATHFEGVGTISAVRRLLEYGWDRESPPLIQARRILFRLLAEDDDPAYLFELAPRGKVDPETAQRGRMVLREAAASALAQAGYEGDPRLRGAAKRLTERVAEFVRSPLGERPWVRVGNQHVLAAEATPPSLFLLQMLAHMPLFRSEHFQLLDVIYEYIARPLPRQTPVQLFGKKVLPQPQLVLGDMLPSRNAADADVPWALLWLELMARLGYLRRNDGWSKLFDRFLDDRDAQGVWHPHKGTAVARSANPYVWPTYPLEDDQTAEDRWTDATFRLGLIARLSGRPVELV